jgi:ATPase inhibitor, mitochondrial
LRSKKKREADGGGMATRRALQLRPAANWVATRMEGLGRVPRYFSDKTSGRVLSEEERAAENVYIQVRVLVRSMVSGLICVS